MPFAPKHAIRFLGLLLSPVAAGLIWSMMASMLDRDLPWAALIIPLSLWPMRGAYDDVDRRWRAGLFGLASVIGIGFAQTWIAATRVAVQFGFAPFETLRIMGMKMTLELVWVGSGIGDWIAAVLAVLVASGFGFGLRPSRLWLRLRPRP